MPTVGDFLLKSLKETGAGVKGTEGERLGDWLFAQREAQAEVEKPRHWYSWLSPLAAGATIGSWIVEKLTQKKAPTKPRVSASQMRLRGYSREDVLKAGGALDIADDARAILGEIGVSASPQELANRLKNLGHSLEDIRALSPRLREVK